MKKTIIIACIGLLPLLAAAQHKFVINGTILSDTAVTGKIFFSFPVNGMLTRDSAVIKDNTYRYERIYEDGGARVVIHWVGKPFLPDSVKYKSIAVFIEANKEASVTHTVDFKTTEISGTQFNTDYYNFEKELQSAKLPPDVIGNRFIRQNPSSWLSYMILEEEERRHIISPDTALTLYKGLSPELKSYNAVKKLGERILPNEKTDIGRQLEDFTLDDVNGRPVSVSDYRGKYVFIDFWAAWCGPCRAESPFINKAWLKYKDKGFDVLGVSFDAQRKQWLDAIEKDQLKWTQVSDLQGMDSKVAQQFGISAIPANFLLDPSGKIIAKNLRGDALEEKLKELIK